MPKAEHLQPRHHQTTNSKGGMPRAHHHHSTQTIQIIQVDKLTLLHHHPINQGINNSLEHRLKIN